LPKKKAQHTAGLIKEGKKSRHEGNDGEESASLRQLCCWTKKWIRDTASSSHKDFRTENYSDWPWSALLKSNLYIV
jgi:hypothetical protein